MIDNSPPISTLQRRVSDLLNVGSAAIAERLVRRALERWPAEPVLSRLLGRTQLARGNFSGAIENLVATLGAAPEAVVRVDLARAYRGAGRPREALRQIREELRATPTHAVGWFVLADILVDCGRFAAAMSAYRRAQSLDPHRPAIEAARDAWRDGDRARAEACYRAILRADAAHVVALCGLAALYLSAGKAADAERLLRHALTHSASFPHALRLLGQTYLELGRLPQARAAVRRSLDLEPRNAQGWLALAAVDSRLMRPEDALPAYRMAERIDPEQRLVHLSIGHILKTLGRRAQCERVYHECLARDPSCGEAYWSLADLKNYLFSDTEMSSMHAVLAQRTGGDENIAPVHFALGRAYEQRGEFAAAFRQYREGNRLRRRRTPFDYDAFESRSRRVMDQLDGRFFDAMRGSGCADAAPIFIVGLPRSGSTLVEHILATHSCVEGTMELPNILNYVREFEQLRADGDAYPESLRAAPPAVLAALGKRYLEETRPLRRGRARFIDKLPNNFSHIGLIHAMLPNATIIDVRRHPLDAGLSCFKQCFAAGQTFTYDLAGLGRYYRQYLALMDHWDAVLPGKVLHVSYEALVREPETIVRRMLTHCGLDFEAQCLRFHENKRAIRTASSEQVRQPMNGAGIGYWRHFAQDLEPLRSSLGGSLARFAAVEPAPVAGNGPPARPVCAQRIVLSCAIGAVLHASIAASAAASPDSEDTLAEVVVTSRRRVENVQDVPQNVDVYTAQNVKDLALVRLDDFVALSPSLSMISTGPGGQRITIRGASDGSSPNYGSSNVSAVGFLVDDLALDYYGHNPDLHLYDIERIEVLNGPQGTLFGPGALTGAVRIITKKPDPNGVAAGADLDGGTIARGGKNWSYEGYANIPLIAGQSAVRFSAFSTRDGGYIDNVLATRTWLNGVVSNNAPWAGNNFNERATEGGRIALLQNLGENWHVTVTGNYQQQRYTGSWEDDPSNVGPRLTRRFAPSGGYNYARFLELHVDGDVGIGDLVYVGGVSSQTNLRLYDFSQYAQYSSYAPFISSLTCATDPAGGPGEHGCAAPYMYGRVESNIRRFSNEVRLQSKPGRLRWTLGAYDEKTRNPYSGVEHLPNLNLNGTPAQDIIAAYNNTAQPTPGDYYNSFAIGNASEITEFADVTFDLDDLWNIEAGVQHFHGTSSEALQYATYFYLPHVAEFHRSSDNKTNLKAGVNFKPSAHSLVYLSFAQGFRDGGYNYVPTSLKASDPQTFKPDTVNNYELGFKTDAFGGRLTWNSAAYLMLWQDYQTHVSVVGPPFGFNANVGDARIAGLETTLEWVPIEGLHLSLNGNYNDARLRNAMYRNPDFVVLPGERLSEAPLFNCSGVARYERRIGAESAYGQIDGSHKGSMWNSLQSDDRLLQPGYTLVNLRVGFGDAAGAWRAEGYVTNVANKRAVLYIDTTGYAYYPGFSNPESATPPRTVGLHLSYNWRR